MSKFKFFLLIFLIKINFNISCLSEDTAKFLEKFSIGCYFICFKPLMNYIDYIKKIDELENLKQNIENKKKEAFLELINFFSNEPDGLLVINELRDKQKDINLLNIFLDVMKNRIKVDENYNFTWCKRIFYVWMAVTILNVIND